MSRLQTRLLIAASLSLVVSIVSAEPLFSFQNNKNTPASNATLTPPLSPSEFKNSVATESRQMQQEMEKRTQPEFSVPPPQSQTSAPSGEREITTPSAEPKPSEEKNHTTEAAPVMPAPPAPAPTVQAAPAPAPQSQVYTGFGGGGSNNTAPASQPKQGGGWNIKY